MTEQKKKKQITATVCMSKEDKQMLVDHAKATNVTLSSLIVKASLKACNERGFKQLVFDLHKPDGYITMPAWMTSTDLAKAAKVLELMEGPVLSPAPIEE